MDTDRANATSNIVITETIRRLKEIHGSVYRSHNQNWALLATKICRTHDPSREPESYERLLEHGPDASMIHLFTRAPESADLSLDNVRQNVSIGRSINNNLKDEIAELDSLVDIAKLKHKEQGDTLDNISTRIKALKIGTDARAGLLDEMTHAVEPSESVYGSHLRSLVNDQEDIDHA